MRDRITISDATSLDQLKSRSKFPVRKVGDKKFIIADNFEKDLINRDWLVRVRKKEKK